MVCGGGCTHSDRDATDSFNGRSRHRTPANIEVLRGSRRERSRRFISAIHPGDSISAHSLSAWATAEKSAGARSAQYEMSSTRSREAGWPICAAGMVCARYPRGVTAMVCAGWRGAARDSDPSGLTSLARKLANASRRVRSLARASAEADARAADVDAMSRYEACASTACRDIAGVAWRCRRDRVEIPPRYRRDVRRARPSDIHQMAIRWASHSHQMVIRRWTPARIPCPRTTQPGPAPCPSTAWAAAP